MLLLPEFLQYDPHVTTSAAGWVSGMKEKAPRWARCFVLVVICSSTLG